MTRKSEQRLNFDQKWLWPTFRLTVYLCLYICVFVLLYFCVFVQLCIVSEWVATAAQLWSKVTLTDILADRQSFHDGFMSLPIRHAKCILPLRPREVCNKQGPFSRILLLVLLLLKSQVAFHYVLILCFLLYTFNVCDAPILLLRSSCVLSQFTLDRIVFGGVFVYFCICVFVYFCIFVFVYFCIWL